jgi:hypothetical protein
MASILSAGTTSGTALNMSGDTSGVLQLATNGTTTALTLDASQNATFAGSVKTNTLTSAASTALTLQSAGTTAVTIDTSQNVGIGTASPSNAKLNSIGADTAPQLNLYSSSSGSLGANFTYKTSSGDLYMATNGYNSSSAPQMVLSASGNVGIGTSSPTSQNGKVLQIDGGASAADLRLTNTATGSAKDNGTLLGISGSDTYLYNFENAFMAFGTNATERMRIFSTGNVGIGTGSAYATVQVYVGTDTNGSTGQGGVSIQGGSSANTDAGHASGTSSGATYQRFIYNASVIGSITQNGTTAVAYNTSSDYRLKENITPLTGALNKVALLKPVTYTWKSSPTETGEGFIAHELAEVCPQAVHGTKDEVDADGKPVYQGIDVSFLVATLTAALQETKALIDTQAETINALTARIVAIESKA